MNEHVKENMFSHLRDLTKEFGQLKLDRPGLQAPQSRFRRTRDGLRAQEHVCQETRFTNLQTEIDLLRRQVNEMTALVERLERRLNESHMRMETPLQELTIRLVTCCAIAQ